MNYYSIEFFKFYLKQLHKENKNAKLGKIIKTMQAYIKDRETNNKSAYNIKWMRKPKFNLA